MLKPNPEKIRSFISSNDLGLWLQEFHHTENELWVQIYKKKSGVTSVTWNDVVITCLCWGWIDGIKKSLDERSYLQRITPRKPKSMWSKRNTEHVERLISAGLMNEAGLVAVRAAKKDGRWEKAYSINETVVPEDFLLALNEKPQAKFFFETLSKSNRAVIAHGLTSAKKEQTRLRRFSQFMDMLERNQKPI